MALVKVRWEVTEVHEAEIEIDGYDPDDDVPSELLAEHETNESYQDTTDRTPLEYVVVRPGDQVLSADAAKVKAPQHEPEWD